MAEPVNVMAVTSPTVGHWRPAVPVGMPLSPGLLLGTVEVMGRRVEVRAPAGLVGTARQVTVAGTWVEYGAPLVALRAAEVPVDLHPKRHDPAPPGIQVVSAPTDGAVWLRPEPGAEPFAVQGRFVGRGDPLFLVEVMKTFSPVRSPERGVIERVLVDDGEAVEAGAPLVWLRAVAHGEQAS